MVVPDPSRHPIQVETLKMIAGKCLVNMKKDGKLSCIKIEIELLDVSGTGYLAGM